MLAGSIVPATSGVIVVRTRIDDTIMNTVVRQMRVVGVAIESKLQHAHSGQLELIAQRSDRGRDEAQVFGQQRKTTQGLSSFLKKVGPWAGYPLASGRRRRSGRYMPGRLEAAEVINADRVEKLQSQPQAVEPPTIARPPMLVPIIGRVAPQLAI